MPTLIPIAGKGTRTKALGPYKPFIQVGDKRVIDWALSSVKDPPAVLVVLQEHEDEYAVSENVDAECVFIEESRGQFNDIMQGLRQFDDQSGPITIMNGDQWNRFELPDGAWDVAIPLYVDFSGRSSYCGVERDGRIVRIIEKVPISFYASSGVYAFRDMRILLDNAFDTEYISTFIDYLICQGFIAKGSKTRIKIDMGNVEEIRKFCGR